MSLPRIFSCFFAFTFFSSAMHGEDVQPADPVSPKVLKVKIVDSRTKAVLAGEVVKVSASEKDGKMRLGANDTPDWISIEDSGKKGDRLKAIPSDKTYHVGYLECPVKDGSVFPVWRTVIGTSNPLDFPDPIVSKVLAVAQNHEKSNEPATAALLYTDFSGRAGVGKSLAKQSELKGIELAGEALDVPWATVFDPAQKKHVMSSDLFQAVKDFQRQEQLPVNGKLNTITLEKMARSTLSDLLSPRN